MENKQIFWPTQWFLWASVSLLWKGVDHCPAWPGELALRLPWDNVWINSDTGKTFANVTKWHYDWMLLWQVLLRQEPSVTPFNRQLTRGFYTWHSGALELACAPLMLKIRNFFISNFFPLGVNKTSLPFLIQGPAVSLWSDCPAKPSWDAAAQPLRAAGTCCLWPSSSRASSDCVCSFFLSVLGLPFNSFLGPLPTCPCEAPKYILNSAKSLQIRFYSLHAPVRLVSYEAKELLYF